MAELKMITVSELADRHRLTEAQLAVKVTQELVAYIINEMNEWRKIRPHLGLSAAEEEIIKEQSGTLQQRLLMLETWKEKFGEDATFLKLAEVFLSAGRRDLAEQVCDFFNQNKPEQFHSARNSSTPGESRSRTQTPVANAVTREHQDNGRSELTRQHEHNRRDQLNNNGPRVSAILTASRQQHEQSQTQVPNQLHNHTVEDDQIPHKTCSGVHPTAACILTLGILLLVIISTALLVVGNTIYTDNTPSAREVIIQREHAVLLGKFDPFYVAEVACSSNNTNSYLYKIQCRNLTIYNKTVRESKELNITDDNKTYRVSELYLVKGSKLDFSFAFNTTSNYSASQGFLAVINVFNNFLSYYNFDQDEHVSAGNIDQQSIQNKTTFKYSLTATQTGYYLVGLHLTDVSVLESVTFEVTGYGLSYDLTQHKPYCKPFPRPQLQCVFELQRQHFRTSHNVCILANTTNIFAQVKYETLHHAAIRNIHTVFLVLGCLGIVITVTVMIICSLFIVRCREISTQ